MTLVIGQKHYEQFQGYEFEVYLAHRKGLYRLSVTPVVERHGTNPVTSPLDAEGVTVLKAARRSKASDAEALELSKAKLPDLIKQVAAKQVGEQFGKEKPYD